MSRRMKSKLHHTIADCLSDLGVTPDHFANCDSLEEEFNVVKKVYFRKMLVDHPDKGGSPETARQNIMAWETLRELKAKNKLKSLTQHVSDSVDDAYQAADDAFEEHGGEGGIPCYDHFYEAASVDVPGYKVELAKSDRSQCVACKKGTGTSLKKKMEAAAAAAGETEEPKKKIGKGAAKGGAKKGKKKRAADNEKEEADGDESKETATDADAEADSKPPARKRGRKSKSIETAAAELEEVTVVASAAEVKEDTKAAAVVAAAATEKAAASKPPTTARMTRSRAAKSEAMVAIADSSSSSRNNKNSKTKKAPTTAAAVASSSSSKTTALAKATNSKEVVVPPANINFVAKGSIRVGSMDQMSGSYGRWHHLPCWRVPYRVWAGLSNPEDADITLFELLRLDEVLLTGLTCLAKEDQITFCAHVMDKSNWAKKTKRSKPPPDFSNVAAAAAPVPSAASVSAAAAAAGTTALHATAAALVPSSSTTAVLDASNQPPRKQAFVIPRPGVGGAIAGCLEGMKFVLTGTFPEVGGGASLNLGKDKVKAMIESFGGKVTGSLSGKTNFLVVGKEPGRVKVTDATKRRLPRIDLMALQNRMLGRIESLEAAKPAVIKAFSAGYNAYNLTNG